MRKSILVVGSVLVSLCATAWAMDKPCKPIADACKKAGYHQGGNEKGKGLWKDCVMVIASGKTVDNVTMTDQTVIQACEKAIMEKEKTMKSSTK